MNVVKILCSDSAIFRRVFGVGIALSALAGFSTFGAATNDSFSSAIVVTGSPVVFSGSLVGSSSGALWWTWIAPTGGVAELKNIGSPPDDFAASVSVYEGDSSTSLVQVASSPGLEPLHFAAQAGEAYHLAFMDGDGLFRNVLYQLVRYDSPRNDNFADRLPMEPGVTNSACDALDTIEPGEPFTFGGQHTLWWTWTAPAIGVVNPQPDENTSIDLYTGSTLSELVPLPKTNLYGVIGYVVSAGQTLQIRADNYVTNPFDPIYGHIQFVFQFTGMATNDQFARRTVLIGFPVDVRGDNSLATAEPGEPQHMDQPPEHTVWYQWTAPKSQRAAVVVDSAWENRMVSVYSGDSLSNLVCVAGRQYLPAPLTFSAARGRTYQIAVGTDYQFGPFRLRIVGPPANDNFSAAYVLSGIHDESESYTTYATFEPGEPNSVRYNSRQSVWWTWQAPVSGWVTLKAVADYDVPLLVFSGNRVSHLHPVPVDGDQLELPSTTVSSFLATSGVTYHISASGLRSWQYGKVVTQNGSVALSLTEATLRLNLYSDSSTLVAPKTVTAVAAPVLPNFGFPTNLVFTEIHSDYWSTNQDVSAAPWECIFSTLPAGRHTFSASGTNAAGDWQFSTPININLAPPNDDFAARIVTNSFPFALGGSLAGATREPGEPKLLPHETASVWHSWTAPSNVLVRITVDIGTVGIYEGDSLSTLRLLQKCHVGTQSFHAIANKNYQLKASTSSDPDFSSYYISFAE